MDNALSPKPRGSLLNALQGASNAVASNVSGPVDILAWALRKMGLDVGSAPVGGSDWMAQRGLTSPAGGVSGMLGEAAGLSSPIAAMAKAPQIAAAALKAGENYAAANTTGRMPMSGQRGAVVWHGSPHKFDAFDASKIGSGEGAQAYGHGLYLSESPDVAKAYKEQLSAGRGIGDDDTIARVIMSFGGDTKKAAAALEARAAYANMPGGKEQLMEMAQRVRAGYDPSGSLYKVDLPDSAIARMLDWDKPLIQQAPGVRESVKSNGIGDSSAWDEITGMNLINQLGHRINPNATSKAASEALQRSGIPGIRYLDGGSRGAGSGTSNYVVFPGEENILKILERNGAPLR